MNTSTKPSWEVYPITNSGKRYGTPVWVRAWDREAAEAAGKHWMRTLGRAARHVRAVPYCPGRDPLIRMYVQRTVASGVVNA